jgi:hypothetical protein
MPQVIEKMERETGFEPATSSLGSWHSTTELLPPFGDISIIPNQNTSRKRDSPRLGNKTFHTEASENHRYTAVARPSNTNIRNYARN